ncbi:MAG: hypothetical protein ABIP06_07655 [Pyrinomonadaceae bacterium]
MSGVCSANRTVNTSNIQTNNLTNQTTSSFLTDAPPANNLTGA